MGNIVKKKIVDHKNRVKKTRAGPLLEDNGVELIPGDFALYKGRIFRGIINGKGEVFKSHPYNIPYDPQRMLAFAVQLIIAMIESSRITSGTDGHFITENELVQYKSLSYDLLDGLNAVLMKNKQPMIEYQ